MPFKEVSAQCIAPKEKTLKSLEENLSSQSSFATQATALKTSGTLHICTGGIKFQGSNLLNGKYFLLTNGQEAHIVGSDDMEGFFYLFGTYQAHW